MSQVDQKRALNKLKHELEPWRNLIVQLDTILTWKKSLYPAIIAASITVMFILLWTLDFSTVTLLSLVVLSAVVFDFMYPTLSRFLFSPDNWSGNQEEQFEQVCAQLYGIKLTLIGWYEFLFMTKQRNSTLFVIIISIVLLFLAYVGAVVNNLLLMYVVVLTVALYPGMQEQQVFTGVKQKFGCIVNSKIQQLREKTKKVE